MKKYITAAVFAAVLAAGAGAAYAYVAEGIGGRTGIIAPTVPPGGNVIAPLDPIIGLNRSNLGVNFANNRSFVVPPSRYAELGFKNSSEATIWGQKVRAALNLRSEAVASYLRNPSFVPPFQNFAQFGYGTESAFRTGWTKLTSDINMGVASSLWVP